MQAQIYAKERAPGYDGATCTPMFTTALFTIAKLWKHPRCPTTDEWIKKVWNIYTMEFCSAIRKNKIMCLQVDRWNMLSKISQTKKVTCFRSHES
jgi:hypothetical protein